MIVYVAGQLLFVEHGRNYVERKLLPALRASGADVLAPVVPDVAEVGSRSGGVRSKADAAARWKVINSRMDIEVRASTDRADALVAVLDGTEPDGRTLAEMAHAVASGKVVFGFWNDVRRDAYCELCPTNPQAERLIAQSGGAIYQSLSALTQALSRERERRRIQAAIKGAALLPEAPPERSRLN